MQIRFVYSEAGGVTKSTTAVSLAVLAAIDLDMRVVLADLDPRGAATKWTGVSPKEEGLDIGAILADEDPEGWAQELAVQTDWSPNLRVIPSSRTVSNREADRGDHAETRLRTSLVGLDADLVVIDCPNRQGGPLTLAAMTAADQEDEHGRPGGVIYAATATQDGVDGVNGARTTIAAFRKSRERLGIQPRLTEFGIVVGDWPDTVPSRAAKTSIQTLQDTGLPILAKVPRRTIVNEARIVGDWYGTYGKGEPVQAAYRPLLKEVIR